MTTSLIALPIVLAVLKVTLVALVGLLLARRGILHETALLDLSNLVIKVTAPCLLFANAAGGFVGLSLGSALIAVTGGPLILGFGYLAGAGLGKLLRVEPMHWRAVVAASTFQNSAYLPIAVATAVLPPLAALFTGSDPARLGNVSIVYVSLFGVLYSPLFWGLGLWWIQENAAGSGMGRALWKRLLPPPVLGVLSGYLVGLSPVHLLLTPEHAPFHFLFSAIRDIGGLTITLANLILGGMLAQALTTRAIQRKDAAVTLLASLVLVPGATLFLLWLTRFWWRAQPLLPLVAFVWMVQAAAPPATNLAVMTKSAGKGGAYLTGQLMPGLLFVSYLGALITLPLWLIAFFLLLGR